MDIVISRLLRMLLEAATSKKVIATVVGLIVVWAGKRGLNLDPDEVTKIVSLIVAYVVGQSVSDMNKFAPITRDRLG